MSLKKMLKKLADMFSKRRDILSPDIWLYEHKATLPKLRSDIKKQVFEKLIKIVPDKSHWRSIVIIGSITGYRYTETSDIDINVMVEPYDPTYHEKRRTVNGFYAFGTRHPVNFMIQEWHGKGSGLWQDSYFGVYDVIGDNWLATPPPKETYREATEEFTLEIQLAQHTAKHFEYLVDSYKEDWDKLLILKDSPIQEFSHPSDKVVLLKKKQAELQDDIAELVEFAQDVEKRRKEAYQYGWGTPRKTFPNLLYKFLEYGKYGEFFLKLQAIKPK